MPTTGPPLVSIFLYLLFYFYFLIRVMIFGVETVLERRGRRRRKLLDELKEKTGCSRLKEEALDRTRAAFLKLFPSGDHFH